MTPDVAVCLELRDPRRPDSVAIWAEREGKQTIAGNAPRKLVGIWSDVLGNSAAAMVLTGARTVRSSDEKGATVDIVTGTSQASVSVCG